MDKLLYLGINFIILTKILGHFRASDGCRYNLTCDLYFSSATYQVSLTLKQVKILKNCSDKLITVTYP